MYLCKFEASLVCQVPGWPELHKTILSAKTKNTHAYIGLVSHTHRGLTVVDWKTTARLCDFEQAIFLFCVSVPFFLMQAG